MRESPTLESSPLTRRKFLEKFGVAFGGAILLNSCSTPTHNTVSQSRAVNRFRMTGTAQNLSELEEEPSLLGIPFTLHTDTSEGKARETTVTLTQEEGYRIAVGNRIFVLMHIESPVQASPMDPGTMALLGKTNARAANGLLLQGAIGKVHILESEVANAIRQLLEHGTPGLPIHLDVPCTLTSEGIIGFAATILGQEPSHQENCSVVFQEELPAK